MKERLFIERTKEQYLLEEYIRSQYQNTKCGKIQIQYTPVGTRIIIYTTSPGLIIGRGGEKIKDIVEKLKKEFKLKNPQIDVQKVENPDLDPNIVAQSMAASLEKGVNYKRLGNYYISRVMEAGAVGCEIVFSGKFSSQRGRTERFSAGYLKKCGHPAQADVLYGFAVSSPKLGSIGVTVKIMLTPPSSVLKKETPAKEESTEEETKSGEKPKEEDKAKEVKKKGKVEKKEGEAKEKSQDKEKESKRKKTIKEDNAEGK